MTKQFSETAELWRADKTILVDFDGVIHNYKGWKGRYILEPLAVPGAMDALLKLYKVGYKLVVFTSRMIDEEGNLDFAIEGIIRDFIDSRIKESIEYKVTALKVPSLALIDDRGIRFISWEQTLKELEELKCEE